MKTPNTKTATETVNAIAKRMGLETLETQNSDSLDFHDLAVWTVREALLAAFEAGQKAAERRA